MCCNQYISEFKTAGQNPSARALAGCARRNTCAQWPWFKHCHLRQHGRSCTAGLLQVDSKATCVSRSCNKGRAARSYRGDHTPLSYSAPLVGAAGREIMAIYLARPNISLYYQVRCAVQCSGTAFEQSNGVTFYRHSVSPFLAAKTSLKVCAFLF